MDGAAQNVASVKSRRWFAHAKHEITFSPHPRRTPVSIAEPPEMSPNDLVLLDGSKGEGGGQILRTALSLSLITGRPFRIVKIRANRDNPGLRPQHLAAIEAVASICGAEVAGANVGSREVAFTPGQVEARDLEYAIGTAGSTALVLQTLHLPLALNAQRGVRVGISGGTFNPKAPSFPFLETTWRRHMVSLGFPISMSMPAAGFYPRGGGDLEAWIEPGKPKPLTRVNRGALLAIRGVAGVCRLQRNEVPERMRDQAEAILEDLTSNIRIEAVEWPGPSPGAAIGLTAEYEGGFATFMGLGERGKLAEVVADEAAGDLLEHHDGGGAIDAYSADQLLLPLALASGRSEFTISEATEHLRTNVRTINAFLDRTIHVEEPEGEGSPGRVIID